MAQCPGHSAIQAEPGQACLKPALTPFLRHVLWQSCVHIVSICHTHLPGRFPRKGGTAAHSAVNIYRASENVCVVIAIILIFICNQCNQRKIKKGGEEERREKMKGAGPPGSYYFSLCHLIMEAILEACSRIRRKTHHHLRRRNQPSVAKKNSIKLQKEEEEDEGKIKPSGIVFR